MRWLFVTYCPEPKRPYLDASARYRCFNRAEDLQRQGMRAAVISQQRFERDPPLDFDVYVFHRPWYSQDFEGLVNFLRGKGRRCLADYDAPLFSADYLLSPPPPYIELGKGGASPADQFRRALMLFETIIASTPVLADWISRIHPAARPVVVRNGLSQDWRDAADALPREAIRQAWNGVGLFQLGAEHRPEIELLNLTLSETLRQSESVRLLVDPANLDAYRDFPNQVTPRGLEWTRAATYCACHTILAPYSRTPANDCLSCIAFFEAAFLGCRCIATPLPDWEQHERGGLRLASNEREWADAIRSLPDSADESSIRKLREYAVETGCSETQTKRLIEIGEA